MKFYLYFGDCEISFVFDFLFFYKVVLSVNLEMKSRKWNLFIELLNL